MQRTEHVLEGTFTYRFTGPNPTHALLIFHGTGGHGGIYDRFCAHHAEKGVDVWAFDAPGHGRTHPDKPRGSFTLDEWVASGVRYAEYIRDLTGLPVFAKGSSLGVAPAYSALGADAFDGAILMGAGLIPGSPAHQKPRDAYNSEAFKTIVKELGRAARYDIDIRIDFDEDYGFKGAGTEKKRDPLNTWSYDLASWGSIFTHEPKVAPADNTKPILMVVGEKDPISKPDIVKKVIDTVAGPVDFHVLAGGVHQLMLYHTAEYSDVIAGWVSRQLGE